MHNYIKYCLHDKSCLTCSSNQFNSIVYFRQESIHMYIIILYNIKYNVYLPLNTDKKINIINFNNI